MFRKLGVPVASQLGFEPGLLVWQAGSLPIKPSRLAKDSKYSEFEFLVFKTHIAIFHDTFLSLIPGTSTTRPGPLIQAPPPPT